MDQSFMFCKVSSKFERKDRTLIIKVDGTIIQLIEDKSNLEMALVRALLMAIWVSGEESPESVIFRQRLQK